MSQRPPELFPWFAELASVKGVGPRLLPLIEGLLGSRVKDLAFHVPHSILVRRYAESLDDVKPGGLAIFKGDVVRHDPPPRKGLPYLVTIGDETGFLTLVFFNARPAYLNQQLPVGETRLISGSVELRKGMLQVTHPDLIQPVSDTADIPLHEAVYPLTAGVTNKTLSKIINNALAKLTMEPALPEWHDKALLERDGLPAFFDAIKALHAPDEKTAKAYSSGSAAEQNSRKRLALDELLASQLALVLVRHKTLKKRGRAIKGDDHLVSDLIANLPYQLTGDQQSAWRDIDGDLASDTAMLRLVQGDVGSGKTVVALIAAARIKEVGAQTAVLAPTEILAQQHLKSFQDMGASIDLRIGYLSGRIKGKDREAVLADLKAGKIDVLIGTHAIIQDPVAFHDLALAIIDEQHRFGVAQRLALSDKAPLGLDYLGLSATPIPRTLTLALHGDMDVSRIVEKPPGRKPVTTSVVAENRLEEIVHALKRKLDAGGQAYWVCPLVTESDQVNATSAEERAESLKPVFGDRVGLLHGQMPAADKDQVMGDFKAAKLGLLVATTVIEVGVDVPNASIMVIEGAERFGLAQLHQLRGRVGRGAAQSSCILIRSEHLSDVARERLRVMRESEDGFFIAEEDLRLRGGGEVLGTRQSGLPATRFVDYAVHHDLVEIARDDARRIVATDADLLSDRGKALRTLLYLFEKDAAVRYLRSG